MLRVQSLLPTAFAALTLTVALSGQATAGEPVSSDEQAAVIERISELLVERYVFLETGEACAKRLGEELDAGAFGDTDDARAFAEQLTSVLQDVSHDKHLRVFFRAPQAADTEQEHPARAQARWEETVRRRNYGFKKVALLEGNVGYLDLHGFSGDPDAIEIATAAMRLLANADALILDMRQNGGGNPEMVQFLSSYVFPAKTQLNSLYFRMRDELIDSWTLDKVPSPRFTDLPLFVLTSSRTFSAAEAFCYNLKTRKRATIIGETTGGGANPGGPAPISDRFTMFMPLGRAINPISGTNWEGVGVAPDIELPADDAYDRAVTLAAAAAEANRNEKSDRADALWADFGVQCDKAFSLVAEGRRESASKVIADALSIAHEAHQIDEADINLTGYDLLAKDQSALAITAFSFNVAEYPESANVYDSLAEAYMTDGQNEQAIKHYRKSLALDPDNSYAEEMIEKMESAQESGAAEDSAD